MSFISKVKSKVSGVLNKLTGNSQSAGAIKALNQSVAPKQTLAPNISTPQGIGQTQKNGSITLLNKQGVATGSVINSQGIGSTPAPSQSSSPYYSPPQSTSSSVSSAGKSSQPSRSGGGSSSSGTQTSTAPMISSESGGAFNALKGALGSAVDKAQNFASGVRDNFSNGGFDQSSLAATPLTAVNNLQAPQPPASAAPSIAPNAGGTAATTEGGQQSNLKANPYKTIDKAADSTTQRTQIDTARQQEDALKQVQIQGIKSELDRLIAQRDALIAAGEQPAPAPQLNEQGIPQPYNPEAQSNISSITAQIQRMEAEIARAMEDSPELVAAEEAYNKTLADEARIKAGLQTGLANVAEQPINYNFITGQSAAIERRAQADLGNVSASQVPLQQRLATEQAKKQSAIDVVKTKYKFLGDERDRQTDIYGQNYKRQNELSDRATTRLEKVADTATDQANRLALEAAKDKKTTPPTPGTPPGSNSSSITTLKTALNASKFQGAEADGRYADPNLYLQNYQSWLSGGGSAEEFFRNFPPATYINPANTRLPREIMQFVGGRSV